MPLLHPPSSGMPLAFVMLLALIEVGTLRLAWRGRLSVARILLVGASALSVTLAFVTGYQASSELGDLSAELQGALGEHHAYGRLLLINSWVMVVLFLVGCRAIHGRRTMWALYYLTLVVQIALTIGVGRMGGDLIFDRGLGVKYYRSDASKDSSAAKRQVSTGAPERPPE